MWVKPENTNTNKTNKNIVNYDLVETGSQKASPIVVLDPHKDVVHPLSADWRRMRDESRHRAQQLLNLHRRQTGNNLVDDIEACSLPCFIPGKRNVEEHGSAPLNLHF